MFFQPKVFELRHVGHPKVRSTTELGQASDMQRL